MVRTHDVGMYLRRADLLCQSLAHEEVIYAPAHISRPGVGEVRPPAVVSVAFGEEPECVHKSRVNYRVNALPLLFRETMFALVGLWVGQIVRRVRYVEVSAENNRLSVW